MSFVDSNLVVSGSFTLIRLFLMVSVGYVSRSGDRCMVSRIPDPVGSTNPIALGHCSLPRLRNVERMFLGCLTLFSDGVGIIH